jgi:hypothetical protein
VRGSILSTHAMMDANIKAEKLLERFKKTVKKPLLHAQNRSEKYSRKSSFLIKSK